MSISIVVTSNHRPIECCPESLGFLFIFFLKLELCWKSPMAQLLYLLFEDGSGPITISI